MLFILQVSILSEQTMKPILTNQILSLKLFPFSRAYDQSGLTVQEDYALQLTVFLLIVFFFFSFFFERL